MIAFDAACGKSFRRISCPSLREVELAVSDPLLPFNLAGGRRRNAWSRWAIYRGHVVGRQRLIECLLPLRPNWHSRPKVAGDFFEKRSLKVPNCHPARAFSDLVQRTAYPSPSAIEHMRVDHRGRDIAVPQQLLHRPDVIASLQQMGGEGVPQNMR
jgi:hypothetical protein